jgi:hypothetical protein
MRHSSYHVFPKNLNGNSACLAARKVFYSVHPAVYVKTMTYNVQSNTAKLFIINANQKGNIFGVF